MNVVLTLFRVAAIQLAWGLSPHAGQMLPLQVLFLLQSDILVPWLGGRHNQSTSLLAGVKRSVDKEGKGESVGRM